MPGETRPRIGVVGLGTMGAALALNIAERGFPVAVYNRNPENTLRFLRGAGALGPAITPTDGPNELAAMLPGPRAIIMMVTAGPAVDAVIDSLLPHLDRGDILIDGGNADFNDTERRAAWLSERGIRLLGMGVSGGEEGARNGPSMMVGGSESAWLHVRPILRAIAATHDIAPCVDRFGPGGAGHFVKTVHNGIEYADMQLIAEVHGLLRHGAGRSAAAIADLFEAWNHGPLESYLVEITAKVSAAVDPATGDPLLDTIVDSAGQKGTGRWTVIEALRLGQSASAIEAAVGARAWSSDRAAREHGAGLFDAPDGPMADLGDDMLESALLAGRILAHAQGFEVLRAASEDHGWGLDLARVAEVWRAGCIIRSALLDPMAQALRDGPPHGQLIFAPGFANRLRAAVPALRRTVAAAVAAGQPVPALSASLAWFDTMRQARGTTDLIQAQRDFFGAHGFQTLDGATGQHGPWHR